MVFQVAVNSVFFCSVKKTTTFLTVTTLLRTTLLTVHPSQNRADPNIENYNYNPAEILKVALKSSIIKDWCFSFPVSLFWVFYLENQLAKKKFENIVGKIVSDNWRIYYKLAFKAISLVYRGHFINFEMIDRLLAFR